MSANIIPHQTENASLFKICSFFIYNFIFAFLWILLIYSYHTRMFISVTKSHSSIDYLGFCVIIILYEYVPEGTFPDEKYIEYIRSTK